MTRYDSHFTSQLRFWFKHDAAGAADRICQRRRGIDTKVVRPVNGSGAYVHGVIDNSSRRVLVCGVAD